MELILSITQVVVSIVLILLVLMHSGKDAGLSGAFGVGTGAGPFGGGSLVERNLDRWTIVFAVLFVANIIGLLKIDA
jgi:preprotein translocase subunit SecG